METIHLAPRLAVPALVVNGVVLSAVLLSRVHRDAQPRTAAVLAISGVISVPFGAMRVVTLTEMALKLLFGSVVGGCECHPTREGDDPGTARRVTEPRLGCQRVSATAMHAPESR